MNDALLLFRLSPDPNRGRRSIGDWYRARRSRLHREAVVKDPFFLQSKTGGHMTLTLTSDHTSCFVFHHLQVLGEDTPERGLKRQHVTGCSGRACPLFVESRRRFVAHHLISHICVDLRNRSKKLQTKLLKSF